MLAGHHLRGSKIDGIKTRRAEAIDLHARHAVAVSGRDRRRARNVAASLPNRIDAAEHHVIHKLRIERIALAHRGERLGGEIERRHFMERPVSLAAPARGAHVIVDEGVGH